MKGVLAAENLYLGYGPVTVVHGISLRAEEGEIVCLLGANGAGKTTTLNALMGLITPSRGKITLDDKDLTPLKSFQVAQAGIALVPEGRRVFKRMTVEENLLIGGVTVSPAERKKNLEQMYTIFPRLRERSRQLAGTLSGGEQQMLAIARALMASPRFLLMDEPSLGLAPRVVQEVYEKIEEISRTLGVGVLLVEQNAAMALGVSSRGYVLSRGVIVEEGTAEYLRKSPALAGAYLGRQ